MKRKNLVLAGAAALLIALNVWRWLPETGGSVARGGSSAATLPEELVLKVAGSNAHAPPMRRDLFHRTARPVIAARPRAPKTPAAPPVPVKTEAELALEAAQAEFSRIRLIGIVLRDGRGQAYLQSGDAAELVSVGDTFGAFAVETIGQDAVELRDPVTQAGGRVSLSGS